MKAGEWLAVAAVALLAWFLIGTKRATQPTRSQLPPASPSMCAALAGTAGATYAASQGAPPAIGGQAGTAICTLLPDIAKGLAPAIAGTGAEAVTLGKTVVGGVAGILPSDAGSATDALLTGAAKPSGGGVFDYYRSL